VVVSTSCRVLLGRRTAALSRLTGRRHRSRPHTSTTTLSSSPAADQPSQPTSSRPICCQRANSSIRKTQRLRLQALLYTSNKEVMLLPWFVRLSQTQNVTDHFNDRGGCVQTATFETRPLTYMFGMMLVHLHTPSSFES